MKNIISVCFIFSFFICCSQTDKKKEKIKLNDNLKLEQVIIEKLLPDSVAYKQFIDLARCNCMDYLELKKGNKLNLYHDLYSSLLDLNQVINILLSSNYSNDLKLFFDINQENRIKEIVDTLKRQDEYFRVNRSSYLICYKAFKSSDAFTKKLYSDFLNNTNIVNRKVKDFYGDSYNINEYAPHYNKSDY